VPEAVFDPLGRRWILLAPERARRGAPEVEPTPDDPEPCDFCAGRESRTPPETAAVRPHDTRADAPGWTVRAFPNLYPAAPFHEVVVHTPDHRRRLEDLDHGRDVWGVYQERARAADTAAVVPIINRGRAAGGSRTHDHGQLFGLDVVPPVLERESLGDDCAVCSLGEEIERVGDVTAVVHPAPTVTDEIVIAGPHEPRFEDTDRLADFSDALADVLRRLRTTRGDALPFNVVVHTAPRGVESFHWHTHVMPRTAVWGGLEVGTELPIVAADPAETARTLRA